MRRDADLIVQLLMLALVAVCIIACFYGFWAIGRDFIAPLIVGR
jgi:hypothetical protein